MHSRLRRHDGSLEVFRPYSRRPVADGHEILVLGGVSLNAVDRAVVLPRTHIKHADSVVLLSVAQIYLYRFFSEQEERGSVWTLLIATCEHAQHLSLRLQNGILALNSPDGNHVPAVVC